MTVPAIFVFTTAMKSVDITDIDTTDIEIVLNQDQVLNLVQDRDRDLEVDPAMSLVEDLEVDLAMNLMEDLEVDPVKNLMEDQDLDQSLSLSKENFKSL